jgi:ligand-binding sensor protein
MAATLVDRDGKILLHAGDYPEICRRVRARETSLSFVCGQTSQVMMKQAERSRRPQVDLCQIGLCKMVIPLFDGDEFIGATAVCSRALVGEELDPFLVAQELGMKEEEALALLRSTPQVEEQTVRAVADQWAARIQEAMDAAR